MVYLQKRKYLNKNRKKYYSTHINIFFVMFNHCCPERKQVNIRISMVEYTNMNFVVRIIV